MLRIIFKFFLTARRILFFPCISDFVAKNCISLHVFFFFLCFASNRSYFARLHSIVDKNGEDFHVIDNVLTL